MSLLTKKCWCNYMRLVKKIIPLLKAPYFKNTFADSKVGIWNWNIQKNILYVNRFWYDKLGYSQNITNDLNIILNLIHKQEIEGLKKLLTQFTQGEIDEIDYEFRIKKSDNQWLWLYLNGKIVKFKKGKPYYAEGIFIDITKQKSIEETLIQKNTEIEALYEESEAQNEEMTAILEELHKNQEELEEAHSKILQSESKFRSIFEQSPIGIIQSTLEGEIISVNNAFAKIFGYDSPEEFKELVGNTSNLYKKKDVRSKIISETANNNIAFSQDIVGVKRDGSPIYTNVYMMRIYDHFARKEYLTTFVEDRTALKTSQMERDLFFNNSGDLMLIHTLGGRIKQANRSWEDILGWSPDELKSMNLGEILHPDDIAKTKEFATQLKKHRKRMNITNRYRTKSGEYKIIRWVSILFHDSNLVFSSGRDETERYEAEQELQKMWDRLELALQNGSIGLWDYDVKENCLTVNSNMAALIGVNKLENFDIKWKEFIHEEDFKSSARAMLRLLSGKSTVYTDEYRLKLADGSYRWFFSRGKIAQRDPEGRPLRISGSITDITEQKEAERKRLALEHQMLQAQKLESLGLLAGGIAHDFNNLLTAILGNAELLCFDLPDDINLKQKLIDIQRAAKRASELTNQMLAYSGKSRFETKIIDINELIQEVHGLLDVSISKKIKIHYQLDDSIPKILADPSQIVQILMNLTINASEAIENTGDITVKTKKLFCDEDKISTLTINQGMKAGNYILLEITDTGCGISEDKIKQIFDPFYTTKFTGRGLGLSAVSGIIRNHNGGLNVKSTIGKGTTFSIYLPASGNNVAVDNENSNKIESINVHSATVLVVDDEAYIRTLTSRMLKNAGYTAVLADNGLEALQIFRDKKDSIDCVLLDLTMPELDGKETLAAIRKIDKNIPVIISSGYSEADIRASFGDNTISGVLQKPYQYEDLLKIIQINIKRNHS